MKLRIIIAIAIGIAIVSIGALLVENQTITNTTNISQNSSQPQPVGKQLFLNLTDKVGMKTK